MTAGCSPTGRPHESGFPALPRIDTLKARVLARLLRGDSLTHRAFDGEARTYRLAAPVLELRQDGWPISTTWETADTRDPCGRVARYGVYDLPAETIQAAGAEGRDFARRVFEWEELRAAARAKRAA